MTTPVQAKAEDLRSRWARLLARCRTLPGESGNAVLELALVVGLLGVPLLLGVGEMGCFVYDSIEISNAANAGALYGMQSTTYAANTSGMTTAAQAEATDFGTNLGVTPVTYYVCALAVTGTQYSSQSSAASACTGTGNHVLQFVQVKTSAAVTPQVHCPGLPTSYTLTGTAVMEVEQ